MNRLLFTSAFFASLFLAACDKPVVVNTPAPVSGVPGPMGPQGAPGNQGNDGTTGATGKTGDSTAIIVVPAASAPAN
jgi:hypothetical protein